jgi:hypothetical protein
VSGSRLPRVGLALLLTALVGCGREEAEPAPVAAPASTKESPVTEFPQVQGSYAMTREWSLVLAAPMKKRFEDGSLVLWRPGLTVWVVVYGNGDGPPAAQLAAVTADASPQRFDAIEETSGGSLRFGYRLREGADDGRRPAFYGFVFGASGYVQMAIYFDDEAALATATALWRSVHETVPR